MKNLLAIAILTVGSLAVQLGCSWPRACCVTEPACCPSTPNVADSESHMAPQPTGADIYVAERPIREEARRTTDTPTPYGIHAYQFNDPVAPLPPSLPLAVEPRILR